MNQHEKICETTLRERALWAQTTNKTNRNKRHRRSERTDQKRIQNQHEKEKDRNYL